MSSDTMTVAAPSAPARKQLTLRAIRWGTLIAGTLDICSAIVMYLPRGVSAERVLQSVASGLLGKAAFSGGAPIAALGLLLHYAIMSVIVAIYVTASRRFDLLTRKAALCGPIYGALVFIVMTFIVVPLSAAGSGKTPALDVILIQGAVHMVCVGLPIALVARRFSR